MNDDRPPLSRNATAFVGAGVVVALGLVAATATAAYSRHMEARRRAETLERLLAPSLTAAARYIAVARDNVQDGRHQTRFPHEMGLGWFFSDRERDPLGRKGFPYEPDEDCWGHAFRYRSPGPVHRHGWDLWSCGPNGIDEQGGGDDILMGEDLSLGDGD